MIFQTYTGQDGWRAVTALTAAPVDAAFREPAVVHILDDHEGARRLSVMLSAAGLGSQIYASLGDFLGAERHDQPGCLVVDAGMIGAGRCDRRTSAEALGFDCPVVMTAEGANVHTAVVAMKTGAIDFVEKPFHEPDILGAIETAISVDRERRLVAARMAELRARFGALTRRERQVMALVTAGLLNKQAAFELGLSEITVKAHRGAVMRKMNARSLADLVRMADAVGEQEFQPASEIAGQ
jgi:FixJ family two-component response regulator